MKDLQYVLVILLCHLISLNGYIWPVSENKVHTEWGFLEGQMFATHNGPFLMKQGESFIETKLDFTIK